MLTPEVDLKWNAVEPTPGGWSLGNIDGLVRLASQSGKAVRGHTLLWHRHTALVEERLRAHRDWRLVSRHFAAVMQRYGDAIHQWDVVNEPIETGYRMDGLRRSVFLEAFGPDYIRRALVEARSLPPRPPDAERVRSRVRQPRGTRPTLSLPKAGRTAEARCDAARRHRAAGPSRPAQGHCLDARRSLRSSRNWPTWISRSS